jgi:hypothetical protein
MFTPTPHTGTMHHTLRQNHQQFWWCLQGLLLEQFGIFLAWSDCHNLEFCILVSFPWVTGALGCQAFWQAPRAPGSRESHGGVLGKSRQLAQATATFL